MAAMMRPSREDIELTFIRSLACGGFILAGPTLSSEDRRERIRVAIMKYHVAQEPLPTEPSMTYSQAFKLAYNYPCEIRRGELERMGKLKRIATDGAGAPVSDFEDEDEDEAELGWL
jgi:hypothetical protein